jgi:hypothetical protein
MSYSDFSQGGFDQGGFDQGGFDTSQLYNPSVYNPYPSTEGVPNASVTEVEIPGSNPTTFNIFKIVIIIILLILIGVTIALALVFRSNTLAAESNENPLCPSIMCPVPSNPSFPTCSIDPTCGASAFRINSAGTKICSSTRYA